MTEEKINMIEKSIEILCDFVESPINNLRYKNEKQFNNLYYIKDTLCEIYDYLIIKE